MSDINFDVVDIKKPNDMNFILGQSHFIKTAEDLYEAIVNSVPNAEFGIAFCEASGDRKVRSIGNNTKLIQLAEENALSIGAGHSFIIFLDKCFPLHILRNIKLVPEVCTVFCATANPTKVLIAETKIGEDTGRGIIGVIDGFIPKGLENDKEKSWRKKFLRDIGYKL